MLIDELDGPQLDILPGINLRESIIKPLTSNKFIICYRDGQIAFKIFNLVGSIWESGVTQFISETPFSNTSFDFHVKDESTAMLFWRNSSNTIARAVQVNIDNDVVSFETTYTFSQGSTLNRNFLLQLIRNIGSDDTYIALIFRSSSEQPWFRCAKWNSSTGVITFSSSSHQIFVVGVRFSFSIIPDTVDMKLIIFSVQTGGTIGRVWSHTVTVDEDITYSFSTSKIVFFPWIDFSDSSTSLYGAPDLTYINEGNEIVFIGDFKPTGGSPSSSYKTGFIFYTFNNMTDTLDFQRHKVIPTNTATDWRHKSSLPFKSSSSHRLFRGDLNEFIVRVVDIATSEVKLVHFIYDDVTETYINSGQMLTGKGILDPQINIQFGDLL